MDALDHDPRFGAVLEGVVGPADARTWKAALFPRVIGEQHTLAGFARQAARVVRDVLRALARDRPGPAAHRPLPALDAMAQRALYMCTTLAFI